MVRKKRLTSTLEERGSDTLCSPWGVQMQGLSLLVTVSWASPELVEAEDGCL